MNKRKVVKLQRELEALRLRKRNLTADEIKKFANACGRVLRRGGKGKEPTYLNEYLPSQKPLSIPDHPGNMRVGTAGNILDILEQDLFLMEEVFTE